MTDDDIRKEKKERDSEEMTRDVDLTEASAGARLSGDLVLGRFFPFWRALQRGGGWVLCVHTHQVFFGGWGHRSVERERESWLSFPPRRRIYITVVGNAYTP